MSTDLNTLKEQTFKKLFYYISDLHLDTYDSIKTKDDLEKFLRIKFYDLHSSDCHYLILGGDISNICCKTYYLFLRWCSEKFQKVFIILGNHEYYGFVYQWLPTDTQLIIQKNYSNIIFLNNSNYIIESPIKINIFGTTLWSDIPNDNTSVMVKNISEIKYLTKENTLERYSSQINNEKHFECVESLRHWLTNISDESLNIVISHYLPSFRFIHPDYHKFNHMNFNFASDLEYLFNDKINVWIFGHTHMRGEQYFKNILFGVNAGGYPNEIIKKFDYELMWYHPSEIECYTDFFSSVQPCDLIDFD